MKSLRHKATVNCSATNAALRCVVSLRVATMKIIAQASAPTCPAVTIDIADGTLVRDLRQHIVTVTHLYVGDIAKIYILDLEHTQDMSDDLDDGAPAAHFSPTFSSRATICMSGDTESSQIP
jgi:hypothetical protein